MRVAPGETGSWLTGTAALQIRPLPETLGFCQSWGLTGENVQPSPIAVGGICPANYLSSNNPLLTPFVWLLISVIN